MYVKGMIKFSREMAYVDHPVMGCPAQFYSTTSDADFKELVRVASSTIRDENVVVVFYRSRSVGMGRIDEDKVYDFGADEPLSRSRSCAVHLRGNMF